MPAPQHKEWVHFDKAAQNFSPTALGARLQYIEPVSPKNRESY
jgi:hypothetical protein